MALNDLKPVLQQVILAALSAGMGGWLGVQITITRLTVEFEQLTKRIAATEQRTNSEMMQCQSDSRELRDRLIRVETRQDTVILYLRSKTKEAMTP